MVLVLNFPVLVTLLLSTDGDEDLETAFTTVQEKTSDELLAVCCKLLVNCELLYGIAQYWCM